MHKRVRKTTEECEIWQWNCRGFRRKKEQLSQLVAMQPRPPAVIALQEVGIRPNMQSYDTHGEAVNNNNEWRVATLVHKSITAIQHKPIEGIEIPHIITKILYIKIRKRKVFSPCKFIVHLDKERELSTNYLKMQQN